MELRLSHGNPEGTELPVVCRLSRVKCVSALLRRLSRWVFTSRRHNPLDSQVSHHVPVVLISVRRIEREQRELRYVEVQESHHLAAFCISHAVECLIAVRNGVLKRPNKIGLRGLCFFDALGWVAFAEGLRAEHVRSVGHMANDLAKTSNLRCRFEGVAFFRHFLRRTDDGVAHKRVETFFAHSNRVRWRSGLRL